MCVVGRPPTVLDVGSGLIYAAIIVMWALYFIPRWLRRHEELSESRSVEKFDHAMRLLGRREATPDQRYVVMPPKPELAEPAASRDRSNPWSASRRVKASRRPASIAVRRRRVLAALLLVTALVAGAVPLSPVPWYAPVGLLLAIIVDLAHLRLQERRRRELTRTRQSVRSRTRSRLRRFDSAERIVEARRMLAERRAAAEAERVEAEFAAHESGRRDSAAAAGDTMGWHPTPVPLPTYVTKPVAPRVGRPIDLTVPGRWAPDQDVAAGQRALSDEIFDQTSATDERAADRTTSATEASYDDYAAELDEIIERRRAVND